MTRLRGLWALALLSLSAAAAPAQPAPDQPGAAPMPTVAGWIETVTFPDYGISFEAKLDTGAVSSTLNVTDLERFKRKGKTWYRFTMRGEGGKSAVIEQQTQRVVRILRAEVEDTLRPIVRLKLCLGGQTAETDFTLTDRTGQQYAVLVGRKFLAGRVLVDAARTHVVTKPCDGGT